ncbi:glycoside hydrolase family 55 protein, protein [Acrodontium crateriforme]|uniref:Glycoside hydrolase family 55 protein, protein n=1 Tax=Acrodontium crateriforme TaxID=150365 RepID=A0AAQ3M4V9_9PEZI|nr:glycoside hydrolase family 55 protein, protein [Acrodontium crateriforme]
MSLILLRALLLWLASGICFATALSGSYLLPSNESFHGLLNLTHKNSTIQEAERLIAAAVEQQSIYNAFRVANPRRNNYRHDPKPNSSKLRRDSYDGPAPPSLNETVLAAAALIAEVDALSQLANGTYNNDTRLASQILETLTPSDHGKRHAEADGYWLPELSGDGLPPMGYDSSYPVLRVVTDAKYGAKGDGVTDDTKAINAAIADGNNCGKNCLSSSVKGTLIYFPPGTYLISSPINAYYYSQLVGDANNRPTIKTSPRFIGLGAIQTDVYNPGASGDEWYIEQSVFYRQVRNFIIDIRDTRTGSVAGLHWQVAQATSLTNVAVIASRDTSSRNKQMGMFTENGSGGFMSDVTLSGGAYGIYGGNQQYTVRDFIIDGQTKACINLIWDWGWTWSRLTLSNAPVGISLINPEQTTGQVAGSTYVMDSRFIGISTGIYAEFNKTVLDSSIITLDNIGAENVNRMIGFSDGSHLDIPADSVDFVVVGDVAVTI